MTAAIVYPDAADDELHAEVRRCIVAARNAKGMTQAGVAHLAGIWPNAYAMIERGERVPTLSSLCRIAYAIFGDSNPTLFGHDDRKPQRKRKVVPKASEAKPCKSRGKKLPKKQSLHSSKPKQRQGKRNSAGKITKPSGTL